MARDYSLPLREAIVTHLKDDTIVTTKQPAAQIYGLRQPAQTAWPFTRYGSPDSRSVGMGTDSSITLHSFTKGAFEDECAEIVAALVESLDGKVLVLSGGERAHVTWRDSQIIPDAAEANAWHGLARFDARIAACA
jgi:hypothetical protein